MAKKLKEFWSKIFKYVAFGNLEETPLPEEQLEIFDINNRANEKPSEENLNSIDVLLNKLEHKKKISRNKESIESPGIDNRDSMDHGKNLL